jgi:hypothetical protein
VSTEEDGERFLVSDEERFADPDQRLIASVEELRALLAQLSERDRRRVLDLARSLRRPQPERDEG